MIYHIFLNIKRTAYFLFYSFDLRSQEFWMHGEDIRKILIKLIYLNLSTPSSQQ